MAKTGGIEGGEVMVKRRVGMGPSPYKDDDVTYAYNGKKVIAVDGDELWRKIKENFGDEVEGEVKTFTAGVKRKKEYKEIWLKISRERFHDLVKWMNEIQPPHLAVASGRDAGEEIELIYHFSLFYGIRGREISVNVKVSLPKNDPVIDTITDVIPGALITEREKQEMLGIKVRNIPDPRRVFTSDELPEGYYPWRNDNDPEVEKEVVRDLSKEGL
ncbi:MAG: NADH-quinone oxidoreductase subunit C [Aquificota bacterium]|nr:MAG: NADH-quinone oxidoreductase subunit C [Aquificota bacterium]RLF70120.1 MAG: NADH-quinone oxidoreductase subunit C [Thermoplasmata archaeon]RLF71224.1 MAG: NADH-quinone oxidoreductase subunit C [Thermoplasmata archaeon]